MKKVFAIAFISIAIINPLSATIFDDIGKGIEKGAKAIKKEMEPKIKSTTVTIGSGVQGPIDVIFQAAGCVGILPLERKPKRWGPRGGTGNFQWRQCSLCL